MNVKRLAWVLAAVVVVAVVALIAYNVGTGAANGGYGRFGFGSMPVHYARPWLGTGLFGFLLFLGLGLLLVWVIVGFAGGYRGSNPTSVPPADGLERLNQLTELHDRGALSDEEFSAAKRKLLGL